MNDWIGCLETTPHAFTPNLDRLAARGVNFTNAHTAGVFCAPSRAAIFSGQHASTTGCYTSANYFVHHPEIESLQMSFDKAGYTTLGRASFSIIRLARSTSEAGISFSSATRFNAKTAGRLIHGVVTPPFPSRTRRAFTTKGGRLKEGRFLNGHRSQTTKKRRWPTRCEPTGLSNSLRKNTINHFFWPCGLYAPHFPNYCPQKYFDLYDPAKIKLPPMRNDDLEDIPFAERKKREARKRLHHERLTEMGAVDDAIHGYLASISYADAMLGRVLDALNESPYADNTIVVIWSDHGYHHGEKGQWGKHTLWERTSNVPFIWAGPEIAEGKSSDVTVSLIDMYPSFVELCDLSKPLQALEGQSLAKTLADPQSAQDRNVFLPYMEPDQYAVINRDWRYIRYGADGEELYDLKTDPNEWNNLASDPKLAARKAELNKFAPTDFAKPVGKMNARKDLVIEGDSFRWEKGKGNYLPPPKHRPYTNPQKSDEKKPESQGSQANEKQKTQPVNRLQTKKPPKNVLFIVCDDLNTHVSPTGYAPVQTPTLAQFASESISFQRAFCQYPVCGPSRASFMSGLYPESTGVLDNKADIRTERPGTITMPQWFKQNGFWTASVGKVFHSTRHEQGEVAWDEFIRFENDELPVVRKARETFEAEFGSVENGANRKKWKALKKQAAIKLDSQTPPGYGRSGLTDEQHKDGKNARQVAKWLTDKSHGDKPFFIACGIQKPHVPFLAPEKYFDLYPTNELKFTPDRLGLLDSIPKSSISKRYEGFGFQRGIENDKLRREYTQAYHACISFIDAQLKIVLDALKNSGHAEDTVVIFTSDHGYHLGDHFQWGKVTLFDIGARVPFIVRAPGLTKSGTTSQAMVELVDIYPTLVDLAGINSPDHLQGVSLRPLLGHPDRLGKKKFAYSVVTRGPKLGYALRNQRWRYGKWPDGEELYNLKNDPDEKQNLAGKLQVEDRLIEFRALLENKQKESMAGRRVKAVK